MMNLRLWLVAAGFALANSMAVAQPTEQFVPNPQGWHFLLAVFKSDARGWLIGQDTAYQWPTLPRADVSTTAQQLAGEFFDNAFRAEVTYRGKTIALSGKILRVARGMGGNAYVAFGPFLRGLAMSAYLAPDAISEAATIDPGKDVRLICTGPQISALVLSVRDCRTIQALNATADSAAEVMAADLAAGKPAGLGEEDRTVLFMAYVAAVATPPNDPCLNRFEQRCFERMQKTLDKIERMPAARRKALWEDAQRAAPIFGVDLNAPALPSDKTRRR